MAVNIGAITTGVTTLTNVILVNPQKIVGYQPHNPDGSYASDAPMLFHYEGEQSASLTSDITDHFIEDNTAINDHLALRPEEITTQGFIGELNDVVPESFQLAKTVVDKLVILSAYTPQVSATALLLYNEATLAYNIANAAISSASRISNLKSTEQNTIGSNGLRNDIGLNQTKQQIAFQQFYSYWRERVLFTVQTPWAIFENMAIKSLRAVQDADTRMITDFEVTFKMMRFASTQRTVSNANRSSLQSAAETNTTSRTGPFVQFNPLNVMA